jgi:transposase InsO family protein
MEKRPSSRSAGDRDPLAPRGVPPLLAIDLEAWAGPPSDHPGDEASHRTHGDRESLAGTEDPDSIFSADVARSITGFGIDPRRTAFQSPWQNGTAERFVGTVRRELLDHVVVLSEDHLRRLLREYIEYYNAERVHTSISDASAGRASETKPSGRAKLIRLPRVGGLHGRYTWRDAA